MKLRTETLILRLHQIMRDSSETALLNGMLTLDKADLPVQSEALSTLLLASWHDEFERVERWTLTKLWSAPQKLDGG